MISTAVLLVILAIFAFVFYRKKGIKHEPDYYAFFVLGLCWLPMGIAIGNLSFSAMGVIFMLAGLVNRDKWKKNHMSWDRLSHEERKFKMVLVGVLLLLLLVGLIFFLVIS